MFNLKVTENNKNSSSNQKLKKNKFIFVAAFLCTSFVVGFLGGCLAYNVFVQQSENINLSHLSSNTNSGRASAASLSASQVVEIVENSVVEIKIEINSSDYNIDSSVTEGAGSGVILTSDGYITTNAHVVEGAAKIQVTLHNGNEYLAQLIGQNEKEDIAVLKINATNLIPISFGDSQALKVGERVIVIGNPLGTLGGSVTDGIISALNRTLNVNGENMTLLQTNAEINHGNSGGGVFGERGQFVGLVVAKSTGMDLEGLGFAIPSNTVKEVVNSLIP